MVQTTSPVIDLPSKWHFSPITYRLKKIFDTRRTVSSLIRKT